MIRSDNAPVGRRPCYRPNRADGETDQTVARIAGVLERRRGGAALVEPPQLDAEADEPAFGRADDGALIVALDIAGVEVAQVAKY